MIDGLDTMMVAAGLSGAVVGALLRHVLGPKGPKPSNRDFTRKQMNTWNINDEWYNILSHKKKETFARTELERVKDYIKERVAERKQLRRQQDEVLDQVREVIHQINSTDVPFERKAILQRMGDISGEHSSIRRAFDKITNALVNSEQSKTFLELVIAGNSKDQITKGMNHAHIGPTIENNEGHAMAMLDAELKAFGNAKTIDEAFTAIGISK